jgi:hypothetical protein
MHFKSAFNTMQSTECASQDVYSVAIKTIKTQHRLKIRHLIAEVTFCVILRHICGDAQGNMHSDAVFLFKARIHSDCHETISF